METPENKKFVYEFGKFVLDPQEKTLFVEGKPVHLPAKEFETLVLLVENNGKALSKEEMMTAVWQDAFVEEGNLAKQISRLRKIFNTGDEKLIETLPKHGYRFSANVSRAFTPLDEEMCLERRTVKKLTVKVEKDFLDAPQALLPSFNKISTRTLFAALGLAIFAVALVGWYWNKSNNPTKIKTVAVLPFKMLDSDAEKYWELGMADALIMKLGNARQIVVRPTSAVRKYAGEVQDSAAAGRELKADAVLEGSIQRSGDKIRISVQLVKVSDGTTFWTETFDEKVTDVFVVQDSISSQVARALELKLTGEEQKRLTKRQTESPEAYQAYLIGRYYWNKRTMEGFEKAIANFNQAIEKDKNFAHAYVGLADSYILIGYFGGLPMTEAMPKAKQAAMEALNIDDSIAEAHASLANIRAWYEWDAEGAEIEFKKAIELNSNYPTAHHWYGLYLAAVKRFDEAVREMKTAQELDPTSLIIHADLGYVYYFARQYDQAIEQCQKTLEMDPNFEIAHYEMGLALAGKGNYDEAVASFEKAARLDGKAQALAMIGYAYAKAGKRGEAEKILRKMEDLAKRRFIDANKMVVIYTALGDKDRAFEWLEKDFEARSSSVFEIGVDPRIDDLRSDIRFKNLLQRIGLPQ